MVAVAAAGTMMMGEAPTIEFLSWLLCTLPADRPDDEGLCMHSVESLQVSLSHQNGKVHRQHSKQAQVTVRIPSNP